MPVKAVLTGVALGHRLGREVVGNSHCEVMGGGNTRIACKPFMSSNQFDQFLSV
jgi:hypothetical protein